MRSMRPWVAAAALVAVAGGCTHDQLQRETINVEKTMADLRFQGILNNLAMMANNPAAIPNPVAVTNGFAQVSDSGGAKGTAVFNPFRLNTWTVGDASVSRQVTDQWALMPLHKPEKLRMMRCAYQVLLGAAPAACGDPECGPDCNKRLHDFLATEDQTPELSCAIPRGWFSVGRKCDVPKDACFSAHYGDTYVWVKPDGIDGLSRFTLTILRIALTDRTNPAVAVDRTYVKEGGAWVLKETTVNSLEGLPVVPGLPKPIIQTLDVPAAPGQGVISPPVVH